MLSKESAKKQLEDLQEYFGIDLESYEGLQEAETGARLFERKMLKLIERGRIEFSQGVITQFLVCDYEGMKELRYEPASAMHLQAIEELQNKCKVEVWRNIAAASVLTGVEHSKLLNLKGADLTALETIAVFLKF